MMDWLDTADDALNTRYIAPFRELRPPAIPPAYRNYQPAQLFALPQNPIRVQGQASTDSKPPVDLAPSTLAKGRAASLKKRRRRTPKKETA